MPKRGASDAEESPRKLVRKSSKGVSIEDPALSNVSDDEEMDASSTLSKRNKKNHLESLLELQALRESFFVKFLADIESEDLARLDMEAYKILFAKLPEEDSSEKRSLVDQYMRDFVLEKILTNREKWNRFLELSINLAKEEICTASIPIALISDLIELSSLQDCEGIFEYVEDRLNVWKEPLFLNSGKNAVLRMCNDLLRRLSRAQNTIFCGRILIFLANYFPFSERSGLNIMSEFNAENVTLYKTGDGSDDPEDKMEIVEEHDEKLFEGMDITIPGLDKIVSITQEEKKKKVKVDYNLYVKFWSLQDFFRNPMQCYNKLAWKTFTLYTQDVLGAFMCFKIEGSHSLPKSDKVGHGHGHSSINVIPKLGDDDLYFPKYLTNRRLLELQMGDPSFRRYFMVQLLIILQYLTTSVKFKTESQVLSEEQQDFVKKTSEKIINLLQGIRPGGKDFIAAVQNILKREELWSKWKNDGCQPFKKPVIAAVGVDSTKTAENATESDSAKIPEEPIEDDLSGLTEEQAPKTRYLGDVLEEADKNNKYVLGNPELTRLWNICPDNLDACRSESRDFLPNLDTFFADAFKELDPEPTPPLVIADPSKREIKAKKLLGNPNFGWRSLRLLARRSPYFFQLISGSPIHPLQNYLEFMLKKIAVDLEMPMPKEEGQENKDNGDSIPKDGGASNEGEQIVEGVADETDELLKSDVKEEREKDEDEEGEVDEKVRNLTSEEERALGKVLGAEWKKVASKLQFTSDEIEFFETEKGEDAGAWMLKMWTEQEKDDATVADLLYQLEGLKLRELVKSVFP